MLTKKIIPAFLVSALVIGLIPSVWALGPVDFNVKIATSGDETYANSLANVSRNNTDVTFQFVEVSSGWAEEYSVNLPAGFSYVSSNTTGNACANFSLLNASNGNYHFSFNGTANCLAKTEFTYRVTPSAVPWNTSIFVLGKNGSSWNSVSDVSLAITATNSITEAVTADLNANGFIDAYILSFATSAGVNASALSGVTVAWAATSAATASGSDWVLPFSDNILWTGDLPQVTGIFDGITLTNGFINEEDGARPRVMTIAGTSATGTGVTIGTGTFTMGISEPMAPASTGSFSLKLGASAIPGTMTLTGNLSTLVFTPTSPLAAGTYTLTNTTGATDWSVGANLLSQTFPSLIVPDTTAPGTGSILINNGTSTTTSQTVSLNLSATDDVGVTGMMISNSPAFSGAVWENYATTKTAWNLDSNALGSHTVYVRFRDLALNVSPDYSDTITLTAAPTPPSIGGGWGGGGWGLSPDHCPAGDLSGNIYDGKCTTLASWTGTVTPTAPWIPVSAVSTSKLSLETVDHKYFSTLPEARSYLLERISHPSIVKLVNSYSDKLAIPDDAYFVSVDKSLYIDRNRTINSYVLLFLRVQDLVNGNRTSAIKNEGIASYRMVNDGMVLVKNFLDRYVVRNPLANRTDIIVYRTKDPALQRALSILENKVLRKFDTLLENGRITDDEYRTAVQAYDDFVLHLSIYRNYGKNPLAKERALSAIKIFTATYEKK